MNLDPQIVQVLSQTHEVNQDVNNHTADARATSTEPATHERWTKLPRARGRQPKDPHAQSIRFPCREIQDLEKQLRDYLQAPTAPAEHATLEFAFPVTSAFSVYAADIRDSRNTQREGRVPHLYGKLDRSAISVIDALAQTFDPKDQMKRQKAIAKQCVEACERADGFRYSFHNNWLSREDEACRFSYFCNDSTLNKGRAANEGANTVGKKMRKAVYDCQGLIAIKFSSTKQSLEVHYKHIPLHKTYAERAPLPRKDSKRYKLMEIFEPEKLPVESGKRSRYQLSAEIPPKARPPKRKAAQLVVDDESPQFDQDTIVVNTETSASTPNMRTVAGHTVVPSRRARASEENQAPSTAPPSTTIRAQPTSSSVSRTIPPKHNAPPAAHMPSRRAAPSSAADNITARSALTWVQPDQVTSLSQSQNQTQPQLSGQDDSPSNGSNQKAAAGAISVSDFEALKAKLEAAEQRIKNLEAEKQTVPSHNQPPAWPPYPLPPHYPYPYPYSAFPYSQAMLPPGHLPAVAGNVPHQAGGSSLPPADGSFTPEATSHESAVYDPQGKEVSQLTKSNGFRGFVAYTPKPQRPILDAQRQDARSSSTDPSSGQSR